MHEAVRGDPLGHQAQGCTRTHHLQRFKGMLGPPWRLYVFRYPSTRASRLLSSSIALDRNHRHVDLLRMGRCIRGSGDICSPCTAVTYHVCDAARVGCMYRHLMQLGPLNSDWCCMQNFNAPAFGLGALAAAQLALGAPGTMCCPYYAACHGTASTRRRGTVQMSAAFADVSFDSDKLGAPAQNKEATNLPSVFFKTGSLLPA